MARQFGRSPQDSDRDRSRRGTGRSGRNSQQNQSRRPGAGGAGFQLRLVSGSISLLFVLLVVLEIAGFIWVADHIGLGLTLLAVLASAFLGLWLIKRTGLDMIAKLRLTLGQGQEPGHSLVDGACFVVAGLLLILPGFFSDFLALLLILPMTRNWFIRYLARKFGGDLVYGRPASRPSPVIDDAEFREVRDSATQASRPEDGTEGSGPRNHGGATDIEVLPPSGSPSFSRPPSTGPSTGGPSTPGHSRPIIDVEENDPDDKTG